MKKRSAGGKPAVQCRGVDCAAEQGGDAEKSEKALDDMFLPSEGGEGHAEAEDGMHNGQREKAHPRRESRAAPQSADGGSGGKAPAPEGKGADLCRGEEEKIVDGEVQKEQLIEINGLHAHIVAPHKCEPG